jgi:hypothetical protein
MEGSINVQVNTLDHQSEHLRTVNVESQSGEIALGFFSLAFDEETGLFVAVGKGKTEKDSGLYLMDNIAQGSANHSLAKLVYEESDQWIGMVLQGSSPTTWRTGTKFPVSSISKKSCDSNGVVTPIEYTVTALQRVAGEVKHAGSFKFGATQHPFARPGLPIGSIAAVAWM